MINGMENQQIEQKTQKSTLLLVIFLFILFNTVQIFRSGITSLYFTEDTSGDYATVEATLVDFKTVVPKKATAPTKIIPVFSFFYNEKESTLEAPELAFKQDKLQTQPFQSGKKYTLWVHKRWGKLIVPPTMGPAERGRSQNKNQWHILTLCNCYLGFTQQTWQAKT